MDVYGNVPADELWYFSPITADDQSGYLWIAGLLGLIYVLTFTVGRIFVNRRSLKLNDWVSVAASVFGVLEFACLFVAIQAGAGRKIETSSTDVRRINQAIYAMVIMFIVAHTVAKVSMALLSRKLFEIYYRQFCMVNIGVAAAWGPIALCILLPLWSPSCDDSGPFGSRCYPNYARWIAVAVLDLVTELILLTIPTLSLWDLNMPRAAKTSVISIFASRLASSFPFFASMVYIRRVQAGHPVAQLPAVAIIQISLTISLITINASALRSLTRPMKSVLGGSGYVGYRFGDEYMQPTTMSKNRTMRTGKSNAGTGNMGSIQVQTEIQLESH